MRDDGVRYEEYCCEYLQEKGYSTRTTVASGDQGADIIAEKDGIRIAVQCKFRTEGSVGNDAIQQALAGKIYYDCDLALVMTNVEFTSKAISAAKKLNVKIWPNIKMIRKASPFDIDDEWSEAAEEQLEDDEDNPLLPIYDSLSPFIHGTILVLSRLNMSILYGKSLLNQKFYIESNFDRKEGEYLSLVDINLNEFERIHDEGREEALKLLEKIQAFGNNDYKFDIVDWYYSEKQDKNIFVYETKEKLSEYFGPQLQRVLNEYYSINATVECPTWHTIVVSILSLDIDKSDSIDKLNSFIIEYIKSKTSNNGVSLDTVENFIQYESSSPYDLGLWEDDSFDNVDRVFVFTSREIVSYEIISTLQDEIKEFYRYRVCVKKLDNHKFAIGIKKPIGLDNTMSVINVNCYKGRDYSKELSITTGIYDRMLVFSVKLKELDISKYGDLSSSSDTYKATVTAYFNQIIYYIVALLNFAMVDLVKNNKIELEYRLTYNTGKELSLKVDGIQIRIIDSNNIPIFLGLHDDYECTKFPILGIEYSDFIGNAGFFEPYGINAMMIQEMYNSFPDIYGHLGGYYMIDTLKKEINAYYDVFNAFYDTYICAYSSLINHRVEDASVVPWNGNKVRKYKFAYGISSEEADINDEHRDYNIYSFNQNYHFWLTDNEVKKKNVIWGTPCDFVYDSDDTFLKDIIEKCLSNNGIKYSYLDKHPHCEEYYFYTLRGRVNLPSLMEEINSIVHKNPSTKDGHVYGFKREFDMYAFVWNEYTFGFEWYNDTYLPIQVMKSADKKGDYLSKWLIEIPDSSHCDYKTYYDEALGHALLTIKLERISIKNIEAVFRNMPSCNNQVWGYWNEMLYALHSLNRLLICKNRKEGPYSFSSLVSIYDSNDLLVALITDDTLLYSCLHDYEEIWGTFSQLNKDLVEKYEKEIVPIINKSLFDAISSLEKISLENDE